MSDSEIEWNDGYILEGMDRCHSVMVMIGELLDEHPAIVRSGVQEKLESATDLIMDCYQTIGQLDRELNLNNEGKNRCQY